ncbi:MAG: hypothetical protein NC215_00465 [Ruminococcus sp.]|nr:hypothetical protein [Ruminococcus sp.]MCM1391777.1 hypothetical protein [Ruminococcus sp.]
MKFKEHVEDSLTRRAIAEGARAVYLTAKMGVSQDQIDAAKQSLDGICDAFEKGVTADWYILIPATTFLKLINTCYDLCVSADCIKEDIKHLIKKKP